MEQNPGRNMPGHKEMAMAKTRVAVLYGGKADEHSISCISAASFMRALDPEPVSYTHLDVYKRQA